MDLTVLPYIIANKILTYMESFPIYKQIDYFYTFKLDKFRKIYNYPNVKIYTSNVSIPDLTKFITIQMKNLYQQGPRQSYATNSFLERSDMNQRIYF